MTASIDTPEGAIECSATDMAVSDQLHGFGGLHGGISIAIAARHALAAVGDDAKPVRSLRARFLRPVRTSLRVAEIRHTAGRMVDIASVSLESRDHVALTLEATLGRSSIPATSFAPLMPTVGEPHEYDDFVLPVELVPVSQFMEIRPTTAGRPLASGAAPELQAWIRLRGDQPVDLFRLIVLFDSLAPSAAATMADFIPVPTVELTVRPSPASVEAISPWVLLDASSFVSEDGWIHETLNAWAPGGVHLGTATQLRVITRQAKR